MNMMDVIEIKYSKRKILLIVLGLSLFIVFGVLFTVTPETFLSPLCKSPFFIRIAGILAILFFGFGLLLLIKEYFVSRKFNLLITEKGIIDNSTYSSVGMIKWEDIISIKSSTIMLSKFLLIYVREPEKYINSENIIKKIMQKSNFKAFSTPITISSNALNCDFNKLEEIIIKSYNMYLNR